MKELLTRLIKAYGPSGSEKTIAGVIRDIVAPYVDEISTDAMGNLICTKKGKGGGKKIMVAAHMDQIGFVVTEADENGFLRVHNVGGIRRANSIHRHVVFENGVVGVIGCEVRENDPADLTMAKLFIDIGARNREEALTLVQLGDMAVYTPEIREMNGLMTGPAMDNRVGCAVAIGALMALKDAAPENDIVCVFTAQEELGLRGAQTAAYAVRPDVGVALDVTPSNDIPKGARTCSVKLGDGVAIKVIDSSLVCTPWVVERFEQIAEEGSIPHQREVLTAGGTDAGAIQRSRGGVPSGVLSVPCRYVHSATETVDMGDIQAAIDLLAEFLSRAVSP